MFMARSVAQAQQPQGESASRPEHAGGACVRAVLEGGMRKVHVFVLQIELNGVLAVRHQHCGCHGSALVES